MIEPLQEQPLDCPYCGARFTALIDIIEVAAEYIQDCEICCRPIRCQIEQQGEALILIPWREDDA